MALAIASSVGACALIAEIADRASNPPAPGVELKKPDDFDANDKFLIVDLHADTLMWRRGLARESKLGQVDLNRMVTGNVGLQILTMPTRVPTRNDVRGCTDGAESDPAPILAMANGWPPGAWVQPFERAQAQVRALQSALKPTGDGPHVRQIFDIEDLERWLVARFHGSGQRKEELAVLLGVEGAHAFSPDLGAEFETLVTQGLRVVGPTHHFTNEYGGSSEGCETPQRGLTEAGRRLVATLFARKMVLDLAHGSSATLDDGVQLALAAGRPVLVSHTGVRSFLIDNPFAGATPAQRDEAVHRATPPEDIAKVAGTGGTVGVIFWEEQIGKADPQHVAGSIARAYCDLAPHEGRTPVGRARPIVEASEHVSIGSDWDGAALNAVDAAGIPAITKALAGIGFGETSVANILGVNSCRVIAENLSGGTYGYERALELCSRHAANYRRLNERERQMQRAQVCQHFTTTAGK